MNRTRLLLIPIAALLPQLANAQSLRGSPASVDRMYYKAHAQNLTFFKSAEAVERAAKSGEVVLRFLEDAGATAVAAAEEQAARLEEWLGPARVTPRFRTPLERELVG